MKMGDKINFVTLALSRDYTDKQNEKVQLGGIDSEAIKWVVDEYMTKNSVNETDPTVPAWAKQPNKPTYTAAEVGAMPEEYATYYAHCEECKAYVKSQQAKYQ